MAIYSGYQPAAACTSGPTPGAKALMSWYLGAYKARGGTNLGIYNCRTVRGASTTSLHGEGRAVDFGINPHGAGYGDEVAELLRTRSKELGVQCVIWRRRIWSGSYPDKGFRAYSGTNPHLDHIHAELSWAAARTLTAAKVAQILSPAASSSSSSSLRAGASGAAVQKLQATLKAWYPTTAPFSTLRVDGQYGPATEIAVRAFQTRAGLTPDGIAGQLTLAALKIRL
jgi:hypothetical protein